MSDTLPSGWTEAPADDLPPGWKAAPAAEADELPPGWKQPSYTLGEKVVEAGKNLVYGGTMAWSGAQKGMGLLEAAGVQREQRDLAAEQFRQQSMTPEDMIPPELFELTGSKDIRTSKSYQRGVESAKWAEEGLGLREGVIPDIVRDVSRGVGQAGTNIGMGLIPWVGVPLAAASGVLGGIGEAGERAAERGATPEQQQQMMKWGTAAGASELADNLIPMLGGPGKALSFVKRVGEKAIKTAFLEGGQEGFQQWVQNLGAKQEYAPEQDLSEDVAYSALVGALTGSIVGPIGAGRRAQPAQQPGVPGEQEVPAAPGLPTQSGAPASQPLAPGEAPVAPAPAQAPGEQPPQITVHPQPQAAAPPGPDPAIVAAAQMEAEKEVLQTQRFLAMKQMMVAEEMGDDLAAEAAQQQYDLLGQQLRSMAAGAADPLGASELARIPLRQQLEASVALIPPAPSTEAPLVEEFSSRGRTGGAATPAPQAETPPAEAQPEGGPELAPPPAAAAAAPEGTVVPREAAESATAEPDRAAQLQRRIQEAVQRGRELKKQGQEASPEYGGLQFDIVEMRRELSDLKAGTAGPEREAAKQRREAARPQSTKPPIQENPEWYYSAVTETAKQILPSTGTAEQLWARLSKAQGVKPEELEWLGVKDWLDAQRGQVSKEDLLTHLQERALTVETTVYGSKMSQQWEPVPLPGSNLTLPDAAPLEILEPFPPGTIPFQNRYSHQVYQAWVGKSGWMVVRASPSDGVVRLYVVNPEGYIENTLSTLAVAKLDAETRINPRRLPLYDSYMPKLGMTNPREVVLHLPKQETEPQLPKDWEVRLEPDGEWYVYNDEGEGVASALTRDAAIMRGLGYLGERRPGGKDVYTDKHFQDIANKIGWFQVYDARGVNGERIAAIRSIQDDTRQRGSVEGYRDPKALAAAKAEFEKFDKEYQNAETVDLKFAERRREELKALWKRQNEMKLGDPGWNTLMREVQWRNEEIASINASHRDWLEIGADRAKARDRWQAIEKGQPNVPFKGQWHEVVVKRILRFAADEGYDAVMFPPAAQISSEWGGATDPGLDTYFKQLYDQKIPAAYKKWGENLGGTVEQFKFQTEVGMSPQYDKMQTWEGVRVTPEMRTETQRRGQPLFSLTAEGPKGLAYVTAENGLPMATVMRFGPDLMKFTAAMEVMQERYGLNFPIEVQLSGSLNVPGHAQPPTIDPNTGKITKGVIRVGARFQQSPEELYVSLLHEFGHYFIWHHEAVMPGPVWLAAENDYKKFRQDIRDLGVNAAFEDMIARRDNFVTAQNSFRVANQQGVRRGRGTPDNGELLMKDLPHEKRLYWLSKEEWMVESIVRFLTTNQQALTTVEKYHKSVANKLREMYSYFKKRLGLTAEPGQWVADWLGYVQTQTTALGEIAAGKNKASQRSNQAAMDADGASFTAVPESAVTQDSRRMVESATANLPPGAKQNGKALAAYADYFNHVYKYAAGLPHLAAANTHIGPLQRYNEINQQWDLEVSNMIDDGTRVLKEWRNRDQVQQDAMTAMIDDYRMMRYLTPQEVQQGVERMPSPLEVDALAAKHGVSKNSQAAFQAVVASYDAVVGKYRMELRRQARKIQDPLRRQLAYRDIDTQIAAIRSKPFVPGMQFGRWTAIMRDSTGKIIHREAFDTKRKRDAALRQLEQQKPPGATVVPSFISKDARPLVGLPPGLLDLIEQKLTLSKTQQAAIEELKFELHPTQSFKHRFSNLNLVPGSSKDFQRGYANFFFHGAHYFGRVKFQEAAQQEARDLRESAQGMYAQGANRLEYGKREDIAEYVENHLAYRLDPRPDFAILRSLGFLWYLGFVPAAALLNVTQIPLSTMPFLSAKFGDRKAWSAVLQASAKMSTYYKKGTMATQTAEELWALDQGIKAGTITEAMAPEMAAIAELDNLSRSTKGYALRLWHNTLEWSAKQFELAEQFNRRVTFRAAYALAKANPNAKFVGEAVQKHYLQYQSIIAQLGATVPDPAARAAAFVAAKDATEQTQGIYKQYAEPKIMRGKARTVLLFKSFYVNTLMMYWNNKDARIRGTLAFTALGGLMAIPLTEDIKGIVKLIGAGLGKDWDLEKEMKKILMGLLGDDEADDAEWADIILHGMSRVGFGMPQVLQHLGVPGPKAGNDVRSGQVDMSKSISLGRGLPVDLNQLATASNTEKAAFRTVAQAAGPVYGGLGMSLFKFFDGGGYAWDDRKRYEYIMPRSMKAVSQGFRAFEEGRERNAKGETVLRYDRTDPWQVAETISLALGFQPARLTAEWDRRMAKMEDTTYWAARQQTIMQQMWLSRGDPEEFARVNAAMRAFNQEVAGTPAAAYAITGAAVKQSFLNRAKGAQSAETGIPVRRREVPIAREVERMYPAPRVVVEKERVR